jgi:hypothetical protein
MTGADLAEEMWRAVGNVRQPHLDRLSALGCDLSAICALGQHQPPFGVERVCWASGGLYEPSEHGIAAVVQPVIAWDDDFPECIDLIAWQTSAPRRWAWRTGTGWALGEWLLDGDEPVPVVETPLEWLASAGTAFCILDWDAPAACWSRLRSGPPLSFASDLLRTKVRNALVRTVPLPTMEVQRAA